MKLFQKSLEILFYLLLFLVPVILWPFSYELFEFNKIITIYIFTVLIVFSWIAKSIVERKFIFRRTILDVPLVIFLITQILSTLISVDTRTSLFGYYSRFNGGLLSLLSFSLLYWAYVSNMNLKASIKLFKTFIFSLLLVSVYGILEHFGIDKDVWVQDVMERVFSTLGQPNWLAALLVAAIPLTYTFIVKTKKSKTLMTIASIIFFLTLLYTKSRSGFLGFIFSSLIFWIGAYLLNYKDKDKPKKKKLLNIFLTINIIFLIINLFTKTPWTPNLLNLFEDTNETLNTIQGNSGTTVLESGGTESGTIRKLVWKGAFDIWRAYPILGSGVETFAFSFYQFRPKEHNLVSEWDFLYNKAHNEYLNYLSTTGALGLLSYLSFVVFILLVFIKAIKDDGENKYFHLALLSGFASILITNFFGFSVVAVNLLFFLYPAISVTLMEVNDQKIESNYKINSVQKLSIFLIGLLSVYTLILISRYWLADLHFAKGKRLDDAGIYTNARENLLKAIDYSPKEAMFWSELSENSADISISLKEKDDEENFNKLVTSSILESETAEKLSPKNIGVLRQITTTYIKLSQIDINYLYKAKEYLEKTIELSPNDAKLYFNLGIIYANSVDTQKAIEIMEKAVSLKENYKQARTSLTTLYLKENKKEKATEQLEYILKFIDPNDTQIKNKLESI